MLSFQKILCPIDFSDPSYRALATADELARRYNGELNVLHVVPPVPLVELPPGSGTVAFDVKKYESELLTSYRKTLDEALAQYVDSTSDLKRFIELGDPAHEIVVLAEKIHCDVIVIATHGRTGLRRFLFGSVAEAVVRRSPCAVLTIPMHDAK